MKIFTPLKIGLQRFRRNKSNYNDGLLAIGGDLRFAIFSYTRFRRRTTSRLQIPIYVHDFFNFVIIFIRVPYESRMCSRRVETKRVS